MSKDRLPFWACRRARSRHRYRDWWTRVSRSEDVRHLQNCAALCRPGGHLSTGSRHHTHTHLIANSPVATPKSCDRTITYRPRRGATTVPGSLLALDVLATITVENERPDGYDRDLFAYGDAVDAYGCRTRARVLIRDSLTPAQVDFAGCAVIAGDWLSMYDGVTWSDPAELEVDHVVALKEAWDSGAWGWSPERRSAFGNDLEDPRSLRAVTGSVNQSKSDKDPSNWIPPNTEFVCT